MKTISILIFTLMLSANFAKAQDTIYVYKSGVVVSKQALSGIDSLSFTYNPLPSGTVSDIDGNLYHWITIGTQKWMVENLKTTHFRTGEGISNLTDATAWSNATFAAWCDYDNSSVNGTKYGHLYNWYAVNDSRKIAPIGWHVASDAEWTTLENYLIANGGNYDGTTIGNKIAKSLTTKTDWTTVSSIGGPGCEPNLNNKSGFSGLPAGQRYYINGVFTSMYSYGAWWTASQSNSNISKASWRMLNNFFYGTQDYDVEMSYGLSVRCIKD